MRILAIDPGPTQTAWVLYDCDTSTPVKFGLVENREVIDDVMPDASYDTDVMAIEMVACYGMAVGKTVFETCVWIGRFIQAWNAHHDKVYRKDVKMCLCNSMRAKDANIRQAILDRFPPTGGGKIPQIGTKPKPGPLYGVKKDIWAALGVAIAWAERNKHDSLTRHKPNKPCRAAK